MYYLRFIALACSMSFLFQTSRGQTQVNFGVCYSMKDALAHKEVVHTLILRNNRDLSSIPAEINQLKNLKTLDVSGTKLTSLPDELLECSKLEKITANASKIKELPKLIGNLKELKEINFGFNDISEIPASIRNCIKLKEVNFSDNNITSIPKGFGKLTKITFCSFANNQLTEFSSEFLGLVSAYNLWLHGNKIKHINTGIVKMLNLSHLLIDKTEVDNIKEIMRLLPELRIIDENNRQK